MKKIRCPKCDEFVIFDEKRHDLHQTLVFECPNCGKEFRVRLKKQTAASAVADCQCGILRVIENTFHNKQTLRLHLGKNTIGKYMKHNDVDCQIRTSDPSMDLLHCSIDVGKDENGNFSYLLQDENSNVGTFVNHVILGDRERRAINYGTIITLGATSVILKSPEK